VDDNVYITKYALDLHDRPNFGVNFFIDNTKKCIDLTLLKWTRENEARGKQF
jgi:hypothetical protein